MPIRVKYLQILKGTFGVFKSPKANDFFEGFLPQPLKWVKSKEQRHFLKLNNNEFLICMIMSLYFVLLDPFQKLGLFGRYPFEICRPFSTHLGKKVQYGEAQKKGGLRIAFCFQVIPSIKSRLSMPFQHTVQEGGGGGTVLLCLCWLPGKHK